MMMRIPFHVLAAVLAVHATALRADETVTPEAIDSAITRGVDFLTKSQNPNGSWGGPTLTKGLNIYAPLPGAHHAFRAGASGLALSGLLDSGDTRPETLAAIDKAAAWTARELPKLRRADTTTTYNVWGHAYGLRAIVRLHEREKDPARKTEWVRLAQEQVDLANRYADVYGGWSYLDLFDELATQRPSGMPTSFTTATMLLAMAEARDAMGIKLDDRIVRLSLESMRRQRTPGFLRVEAVFGLLEDRVGVKFEDFAADFLAAIGGQAVEHDVARSRVCERIRRSPRIRRTPTPSPSDPPAPSKARHRC
jgi:hypothetical protein